MSILCKKIGTKLNKLKSRKSFADITYFLLTFNFSLFILFSIYSERITKVCFTIGLGLYVILRILEYGRYFYKHLIVRTPLNKAICIFLATCALSVIFSYDIYSSQKEFFNRNLFFAFFSFMGVYLGQNKKNLKTLVFLLLTGALFSGLGGVVDIVRAGKIFRLFSSWGIYCFNGTYFLLCLPFSISLAIFHSSHKVKFTAALVTVFIFVCFLFNQFRGAWISLGIALICGFFIFKQYRKIGLYVAIAFISIIFIIPAFRSRLFSDKTLHPETWGDRVTLWNSAIGIFLDFPVFGIGLGGFEEHNYDYGEGNYKKPHAYAHNVYLDVLSETGVLGLFSFLWIFYVFFRRIYLKLKIDFDIYKFASVLMVLSILLFQLTESTLLTGVRDPALFWFLIGVANE